MEKINMNDKPFKEKLNTFTYYCLSAKSFGFILGEDKIEFKFS